MAGRVLLRRIERAWRKATAHIRGETDARVKRSLLRCGANSSIRLPCVIEGPDFVEIGSDVSIAAYLHIWGHGGVTIGNRTLIASHVAITSLTHDADAPSAFGTLIASPVVIGHDVWIGAHSVVLPGVTIGDGCVVAAGSVVRESVAPYSIVAGAPARIVRMKRNPHEDRDI